MTIFDWGSVPSHELENEIARLQGELQHLYRVIENLESNLELAEGEFWRRFPLA